MAIVAWALQDAKNRFSEVVQRAEAGVPQRVTKRGKDAVVVVAAEDYDRMVGRPTKTFIEHILSFPRSEHDVDFELPPREREPAGPGLFDEEFDVIDGP